MARQTPLPPPRVRCAHDYYLLQDSCPGCDREQETPHPADPVDVWPTWAKRAMRRCRRCGLVPSDRVHRRARQALNGSVRALAASGVPIDPDRPTGAPEGR